jgi:hypothetical protein
LITSSLPPAPAAPRVITSDVRVEPSARRSLIAPWKLTPVPLICLFLY